jgi:hemerythrin
MSPTDVRAELLRQHAELRDMIATVQRVAERASKGTASREELLADVTRLADALGRHNRFEEEWLRTIEPKVDGPTRADMDVLLEAHAREHEELHAAVVGIPQNPVKFSGVDVAVLLKDVLQHMDDEEASQYAAEMGRAP